MGSPILVSPSQERQLPGDFKRKAVHNSTEVSYMSRGTFFHVKAGGYFQTKFNKDAVP